MLDSTDVAFGCKRPAMSRSDRFAPDAPRCSFAHRYASVSRGRDPCDRRGYRRARLNGFDLARARPGMELSPQQPGGRDAGRGGRWGQLGLLRQRPSRNVLRDAEEGARLPPLWPTRQGCAPRSKGVAHHPIGTMPAGVGRVALCVWARPIVFPGADWCLSAHERLSPTAPTQPRHRKPVQASSGLPRSRADVGGSTLFLSDMRLAFLVANDVRYRVIQGLFRVPRDQVNLATLVGLLVLAEGVGANARLLRGSAHSPSTADNVLGAAMVNELLSAIAGPSSRDAPLVGGLLAIAAIGGVARATVGKSARGVWGSSHKLDLAFHHRYGYLIDPGHWRARRARRREARTPTSSP
jgi:hypothetical protein